jgi:integrase/recombinase XerD
MRIRLKFLCEDRDRHGNVRCYVRMPGKPKMRIRTLPGTPEFMEEYQAAISAAAPKVTRQADEAKKDRFATFAFNTTRARQTKPWIVVRAAGSGERST